jgi:hypothetical protein
MDSDEDMFACCNEPSQSQPISLSPASSHELYEPSPQSSLSLGGSQEQVRQKVSLVLKVGGGGGGKKLVIMC